MRALKPGMHSHRTIPFKPLALGLALALAVVGSGCTISPKPEPPAGQKPSVDMGEVLTVPGLGYGPYVVQGGPGAAYPPGALVRVFNLDDSINPPAEGPVQDDGSFAVEIDLSVGDEIRLQVIATDARSQPVDAVVRGPDLPLELSVRALADCLLLEPALELELATEQVVRVQSSCEQPVHIIAPHPRVQVEGGIEVGWAQPWPLDLSFGEMVSVDVRYEPPPGTLEEVFFVEATTPEPDRRPITAWPAAP